MKCAMPNFKLNPQPRLLPFLLPDIQLFSAMR